MTRTAAAIVAADEHHGEPYGESACAHCLELAFEFRVHPFDLGVHLVELGVDCGLQFGITPFEPFILPLEPRIQLLE